jgi:hypothetical protein
MRANINSKSREEGLDHGGPPRALVHVKHPSIWNQVEGLELCKMSSRRGTISGYGLVLSTSVGSCVVRESVALALAAPKHMLSINLFLIHWMTFLMATGPGIGIWLLEPWILGLRPATFAISVSMGSLCTTTIVLGTFALRTIPLHMTSFTTTIADWSSGGSSILDQGIEHLDCSIIGSSKASWGCL